MLIIYKQIDFHIRKHGSLFNKTHGFVQTCSSMRICKLYTSLLLPIVTKLLQIFVTGYCVEPSQTNV